MRIGIHTSIAGALDKAAHRAAELGANTFQIFSCSPRMWRAVPPDADEIRRMRDARARFDLNPLVIHDNYLINLASSDEAVREKSVAALRGELTRAAAIGAEYVVAHPGNYRGGTLEEGIVRFARSLIEAAAGVKTNGLMLLLENTAGSGAAIGASFEELAAIRELALSRADLPIGYCLDTAHCLASGYDVATAAGLREMLKAAEGALGLERVRVIHANDSKTPLSSRVDRHEHIGRGYIGVEGFRRILTHPKLRAKPFILETPIDKPGDDARNIAMLKSLCRKSRTTTK
ncbi:MAG: deoxyribonuclease IV [Bryobacteraceae bacterium]|nr:deoxyribonuclease IV [Bryobacteraceae bacterium]